MSEHSDARVTRDEPSLSSTCLAEARRYGTWADAEYDRDRNGNFVSGYPDRNNHTIDATRYALEQVIRSYRSNA